MKTLNVLVALSGLAVSTSTTSSSDSQTTSDDVVTDTHAPMVGVGGFRRVCAIDAGETTADGGTQKGCAVQQKLLEAMQEDDLLQGKWINKQT